ncbi:MAG: inositol monophosphatase family protein [Candidatus Zixiibacteriota bacterium]
MKECREFKKIAIQTVLKAGEILNKNRGRVKKVDYKGKINIVTEIDLLSERAILKLIKKNFSDHSILTEESKEQKTDSDYKWIIDPLDGTTNYAHDFPSYCISIALEKEGKVILGVVYNPLLEELFTVETGKGAFLDKRRIGVSSTRSLSKSFLATGFPYDIRESKITNLDHFANFAVRSLAVRRAGSAALDLCYLAMGRFDGFWELKLSPWDTAAATLLVKEAGGKVTDFEGKKYSIYSKHLLATNGRIHQQMIKVLKLGKF